MISSDFSLLTNIVSILFVSNFGPPQQHPVDDCFKNASSLVQLVNCFQQFTVTQDFYNHTTYLEAQPNPAQREAWSTAISTLLHTNNNCSSAIVPAVIQDVYSAAPFTDSDGSSFCVVYERAISAQTGLFDKGWGYIVTPALRASVSRHIHISAPHPIFDGNTSVEAAQLFKETRAKSLLIPGRIRTAYRDPSTCIKSTKRTTYYMTDTAHNDLEPFFDANVAIWNWQSQHGGCSSASCAFIQMHGKSDRTCVLDDIFLSSGLGNNSWYTNEIDRPIKRLKKELLLAFNHDHSPEIPVSVSVPSDSKCLLTATKNVVGRYLNGLPSTASHDVCTRESKVDTTEGVFIHVEQSSRTASKAAWIKAVNNTFAVVNSLEYASSTSQIPIEHIEQCPWYP
ncbi:hypothetical protein NP233_g6805 [Leucocoprinus birnbaumii]|uniref:Uncharacterized protein n=1 Tax=Leucocoprinus birnbaumii TaxID=56174 RepID=A0AAD5VVY5_9AGAR|nr:hypothetical protein NP233_g6805 [Leucocoprinus birnbaumii]